MVSRREFLKLSGAAGGVLLASRLKVLRAWGSQEPSLLPTDILKYVMPLVIPPAMPITNIQNQKGGKKVEYYEIAMRQFEQQILPNVQDVQQLPKTKIWSYGSVNHPGTFNYPAYTFEATWNKPVQVKWINELVDSDGNYLPHLLPVDQTLHWANPPGGEDGRDKRPHFDTTPGSYTGPVPMVTHVHGAHTYEQFDGYPEAWYLPAANNILDGYATTGTWYDKFVQNYELSWEPGTAVFEYPNEQRATTLWYHDHTLGMTRLNVYAGPAGFYIVRGGSDDVPGKILPGPAPVIGSDPFGTYYEIPIVIQDRSFNDDGSLFYPDSREFFDEFTGPYIPKSDVPPIWNPEFFGNTMVVNGRTWPYLEVEQRRYRFRFLNGCNSRFLILKMDNGLPFWQIGAEGGFLPAPVELDQLLMGPAERADVIVDFTNVPVDTEIILLNLGPDDPFGGGEPPDDFDAADPGTTGQVMQFRVIAATGVDVSHRPDKLVLPPVKALDTAGNTRQVSLNEDSVQIDDFDGPIAALLGVLDGEGKPVTKLWMDEPPTEQPEKGSTEVWEIYNFTADAHPIHVHLVQFQVQDRQALLSDSEGIAQQPAQLTGNPRPPESWETGFKDTVVAYPGEVTRIKAKFDIKGRFVWHCHIVEHEDNEMMRPYEVV